MLAALLFATALAAMTVCTAYPTGGAGGAAFFFWGVAMAQMLVFFAESGRLYVAPESA